MVLLCIEQPLLNYLFVTSGRRITSLSRLGPCMPQEWYAGRGGALLQDGQLRFKGRSPLFVHWPGQRMPTPPPPSLSETPPPKAFDAQYRVDPEAQPDDMPYYALWKYYWDRA